MFERENFKSHAFICTSCLYLDENNKPCADDMAENFRKKVKEMAKQHWDSTEVRINGSGCLDRCERGMCAVIYPQEKWLEKLRPGDEQKVIDAITEGFPS